MLMTSHQTTSRKKQFTISKLPDIKMKGIKSLAEAIILQSLEDLHDPAHSEESRKFFQEGGFRISSEVAGLNTLKQLKLLYLTGGRRNERNIRRS